jgi:Zn-dependent peptidase ImmA (M78 family)
VRLFYRREEVEQLAAGLLRRLSALRGEPIELPVDVDAIGEQLLGLSWLYEPIPEPRGTTILAALHPEQRLVVLNERHVETFGRNEGLERFTKAHELGHWICHCCRVDGLSLRAEGPTDWSLSQPSTLNPPASRIPEPSTDRWQENHANWFAAALLMPPLPLRRAAGTVDITAWRGRYELRERCGVSISALNVRLRQLGYPPVKGSG